jgi:hypothetical protein
LQSLRLAHLQPSGSVAVRCPCSRRALQRTAPGEACMARLHWFQVQLVAHRRRASTIPGRPCSIERCLTLPSRGTCNGGPHSFASARSSTPSHAPHVKR